MRCSNYLRQTKRRFVKENSPYRVEEWHYSVEDKIVGKDALANLMEVTETCVELWIKHGMPVDQRADQLHDWIFNLDEVKKWYSLSSNVEGDG